MADVAARHVVYLSVGSNLGDKLDNCLKGIAAVTETGESALYRTSRFYRTSPVDFTDQDWFVNAVVKICTRLDSVALLDQLIAIQKRLGRKTEIVRFGPRVLDLDILLYDDCLVQTQRLEIPHPRMHKRAFVLQPICDIDPAVTHPVLGKTVAELLECIEDKDQRVIPLENQPTRIQSRPS